MSQENNIVFLNNSKHHFDIPSIFSDSIFITSKVNEALNILDQGQTKVVMAIQSFEDISGLGFFKMFKENHPNIVCILITEKRDDFDAQKAISEKEIHRFICYPWDEVLIHHMLNDALMCHEDRRNQKDESSNNYQKSEAFTDENVRFAEIMDKQKAAASIISHELRTPLASIKMAIDIVLSGTAGPSTKDQKNFLNKAKNNIDRLKRLIDEVLDMAKLESGKMQLNFRLNSLNQIIKNSVENYETLAREKGIKCVLKLDPNDLNVSFDQDKMIQVMNNLLSNALKFTDEGKITISVKYPKDMNYVEICVSDSGMGIEEENISKLFEKFTQVEDPLTRKIGGTGLGLAICKEIIEQHGGKIWIESKINKGTQIYFVLPMEERRRVSR